MSEVFTFVDASHVIAKANLWEERDTVIKKKYDKLNKSPYAKRLFLRKFISSFVDAILVATNNLYLIVK